MVFYIFAVAALNLGLGFAVAVLLARRSQAISAAPIARTASVSADVDFDEPAGAVAASPAEEVFQTAEIPQQSRDGEDEDEVSPSESLPVGQGEAEPRSDEQPEPSADEQPEPSADEAAIESAQRDFEQLFRQQQQSQDVVESSDAAAGTQAVQDEQTSEAVERIDRETGVQEDRRDELTGLANRAALEGDLDAWWEKDPHGTKPLCVAMIDLDEFARVNERCGRKAADRVLQALSQLLAAESGRHATACRFSGKRFILLFEDRDARYATQVVERIRQLIEVSRLRHEEDEIRVTVSCAVTEAAADDSPASFLSRCEATLQEAKRYGRNRTFVFENGYPVPVVPPSFSLEEKTFTI